LRPPVIARDDMGIRRRRPWLGFVAALASLVHIGCSTSVTLPAKAIALNRQGAAALAAGDLELAEARVALALEYNARFTEAWVNLGLIELRRGNFERADRDLITARDLNPDLPTPHHALGLLASQEGKPEEAERRYRAALRVDPGFAPSRINLGRSLFERAAFEDSREQFLRLTQVAPDFPEGWTGLCESLLKLDRIPEAQGVLVAARQRLGASPVFDMLSARALVLSHDFRSAAAKLEVLTALPDRHQSANAWAWLAVARLGGGDVDAAHAAARQAIGLDSENEVARYVLRVGLNRPPATAER
jgi:tetratricopeptide (TPR) repeat protein